MDNDGYWCGVGGLGWVLVNKGAVKVRRGQVKRSQNNRARWHVTQLLKETSHRRRPSPPHIPKHDGQRENNNRKHTYVTCNGDRETGTLNVQRGPLNGYPATGTPQWVPRHPARQRSSRCSSCASCIRGQRDLSSDFWAQLWGKTLLDKFLSHSN